MDTIPEILRLIQAGQTEDAIGHLQSGLKTEPDHPRLNHLMGVVLLQTNQIQDALPYLHRATSAPDSRTSAQTPVWVALATGLIQSGDTAGGCAIFADILTWDPDNTTVKLNYARALAMQQNLATAADIYTDLVTLLPDQLELRLEQAEVLQNLGHTEQAASAYTAAVDLDRSRTDIAIQAGFLWLSVSALDQAATLLQTANVQDPHNHIVCFGLGTIALKQGHKVNARQYLCRAHALSPTHRESAVAYASFLIGEEEWEEAESVLSMIQTIMPEDSRILRDLGWCQVRLGMLDKAVAHLEAAFAKRPDDPVCQMYLAMALASANTQADHLDRAAALFLPLIPEALDTATDARLLYNAAHTLYRLWRIDAALPLYERALALKPKMAEWHNNYGAALYIQGAMDEALASFQKAEALDPQYQDAQVNQAYVHLLTGQLAQGWALYENRWGLQQHPHPEYEAPVWTGAPLPEGTLLIYLEQGMGDAIQFIRYVPQVQDWVQHIMLVVHAPLVNLFRDQWPTCTILPNGAQVPPFDAHIPLMSLARIFKTNTVDQIPAPVPYLTANPEKCAQWRHTLANRLSGDSGRKRIGLVWQGSPTHVNDRHRSIDPSVLTRHFKAVPADWISVQVRPEPLPASMTSWIAADVGPDITCFADTAAVIETLDLLITVDSAPLHLAGALGKPVWGLIPYAPDFRWLRERADSPWYPTARLYRQPCLHDWDTPLSQIARDIEKI